ncbi:restriction endonuclease subunit S [Burkholderia gladioli]|uniref:restriction endonuclease subunit S n=1 Tax=Burkholderia gladioli TaxID=28095 RepID=UPI00163F71D5|nr:restriction endonuclease subunit S [Burkholderia gladioli]
MTFPATWKTYKLGELASYINGKAFKPEDWKTSGLPIIRIQNLTDRSKPFNYCDQQVEPRYQIKDGDLLISWSATLGSFVWDRGPALLNQHIFKAVPNTALVERDFLHFLMLETLDEMASHAHGIAMKHITKGKFEAIEVAIPPIPEQRRIVARIKGCLERVEEIGNLRNQATREAASIEFACFHDALMDGVQHKSWPVLTLGDVAKSFRYGTSAKAHTQPEGIPVLRMGNLQGGYLDISDLKYINLPDAEAARYKLRIGDVLINRTNSLELVGKAATFNIGEGYWVYASYLVRVEIDRERVLPEFVTAVINSSIGREYVLRTARRAIGMVNLNAKEMAKFPIPVPPLDEQEKVVAQLKIARPLAEELRTSMTEPEISFLKQSILQKAFAGEL